MENKDKEMFIKNKKSFKRFTKSFGYAEEGIRYAFYHEQNIIKKIIQKLKQIFLR